MDQQRVDVRARPSPRGRRRPPRRSRRAASTARGLWLKIWIERQPRSSPRSTAFAGPPAGETWAPISMAGRRLMASCVPCASASLRRRPAPCTSANARTALYNWLLARGHGGELVLRIEDTDRERSTPENVEQIFDALRLARDRLGRGPDLPVRSAPTATPRSSQQLLDDGHAYRSTAGPDEVKAYKEAHGNRGFRGEDEGDGRGAPARARRGRDGRPRRHPRRDARSRTRCQDDLVIARADGTPIYHLAVVVDDLDAGITHVVRGADHYSNTPKHDAASSRRWARRAAGLRAPAAAPRPRRQEALQAPRRRVRAGAARCAAICPRRCINYLALLGWGYDEETTFFTIEELQQRFSLERVSKAPAVFDEQKLRWMNGRYLRELAVDDLTARLEALTGRDRACADAVAITQEKISTLAEFWPLAGSFFDGPADDPEAREKFLGTPEARAALERGARGARPSCRSRGRRRAWRRALRGVVEQPGVKPQAGLPAVAGRADRDDRLTRYLRDGRAAGARRDAGTGGRCARRRRRRDTDGDAAGAQPSVHALPIRGSKAAMP